MPLPVEFQQGRLGRPPEDGWEQPGCLSEGAPLLPPLPATATATVGTESEGACITPDDLYRFLDTSSSSISSNLFNTITSSTGSTSLPYTTPSTDPAPGPSFAAFEGANNAFGLDALFSSSVKEQPPTALAAPAKAFDAGDILLPFDLAPSSASVSAADLLAFPVFDTSSTSSLPPLSLSADPLSLDATLDSPLGLTGSGCGSSTTSPLSEFLASPMFSLPGSAMASTTFSELPLPSLPGDAVPATTSLPFFPPLPSLPPSLDFAASLSSSTTTFLRPSPPLPTPALPAAPSPAPSSKGKKRPSKPTGFAPSATPLLPLDAPIQSRNSVLPSATSRKRKTAQAEKALAKRRKTAGDEPTPALEASSGGAEGGEEDLPADIVAAVERKRLQNTLSARKSRARKQARLQELEMENEQLKARVEELERMLAAAAGRG